MSRRQLPIRNVKHVDTPFEARMQEMVMNAMTSREAWIRRFTEPRRDIDSECGYPASISPQRYSRMWRRFGIAKRVVNIEPIECWQQKPEIYDSEKSDKTPFEEAWTALNTRHKILSRMLRADMMSGIGRYGIMLFGLNDGKPLSSPVAGMPKSGILEDGYKIKGPQRQIMFVRCFDESMARITQWETDTKSPRFGMPKMYTLILLRPDDMDDVDAEALQPLAGQDTRVHWTRVVHIARDTTSSEVLGTPTMEDVFNHLLDLRKICGAGAEGYWQGGFPGLSFESQPGLENFDLDIDMLKKQARHYFERLQRYIATIGMNVKSLAPNVGDPTAQFEMAIKAICTTKGCPYRIFMGTEEAKLAGDEDKDSWKGRMSARRVDFVEPDIVRPVVDRCIMYGELPEPKEQKYMVEWPDMHKVTDLEQAQVAQAVTAALSQYVSAGIDELMTPEDYLTQVHKFDPEVVKTIMQNSMDRHQAVNAGEDVVLGGPSPDEIAQQAVLEHVQKQQMRGGGMPPNGKSANGAPKNGKPAAFKGNGKAKPKGSKKNAKPFK